MVFGTLVYNEILILPFWGFDKNTKRALKQREDEHRGLLDDTSNDNSVVGIAVMSPHAGYDASRNERVIQHKMDEITQARN